jgi:hypothetical protein
MRIVRLGVMPRLAKILPASMTTALPAPLSAAPSAATQLFEVRTRHDVSRFRVFARDFRDHVVSFGVWIVETHSAYRFRA